MRRYISHCRKNIQPILSDESIELLSNLWACLREKELHGKANMETKVLPVTIRSYETLIRLSTAHAKLRLSSYVELEDCVQAFQLVVYTLYKNEKELDKELREIIKKVTGEESDPARKNKTNKKVKPEVEELDTDKKERTSRRQPRVDEQIKEIASQIERIDVKQDDKNVDQALNATINKKKLNSEVFTAFTKILKSGKREDCSVQELAAQLPHLSLSVVQDVLRDLDSSDKVFFEENKGRIHSV